MVPSSEGQIFIRHLWLTGGVAYTDWLCRVGVDESRGDEQRPLAADPMHPAAG